MCVAVIHGVHLMAGKLLLYNRFFSGINYVGQNGELRGCHNDVLNVSVYGIVTIHGGPLFSSSDLTP